MLQAERIETTLVPFLHSLAQRLKGSKTIRDPRLQAALGNLEEAGSLREVLEALKPLDAGEPAPG